MIGIEASASSSMADRSPAPARARPSGGTLVEVAVTLAVKGRYHYRVPSHLADMVHIGTRVLVRFGPRKVRGGGGRRDTEAPAGVTPIDITDVLDRDQPALLPALVELCLWIADYYEAPPGEVVRAALPA